MASYFLSRDAVAIVAACARSRHCSHFCMTSRPQEPALPAVPEDSALELPTTSPASAAASLEPSRRRSKRHR